MILRMRVLSDKLLDSDMSTCKVAVNPLESSVFAIGVRTFDKFHYAPDFAFGMISA